MSKSSRRTRIDGWDWLRIAAAFDTAANHVAGRHGLFGFGLPLFIILSVALSVSRQTPEATESFVTKRVYRVLVPWAFWSLILTIERAFTDSTSNLPSLGWWKHEMWLYGPSIHLWFLPAIFGAGVCVHALHRLRATPNMSRWLARAPRWVGPLAVGAGATWLLTLPVGRHIGWPYEQWLFTLPALPFGWMIGRTLAQASGAPVQRRRIGRLALLSGTAMLAATFLDWDSSSLVLRYLGAVGALLLAWVLPTPGGSIARWFAPLMLGVYILHPAIDRWLTKKALSELGNWDVHVAHDSTLAIVITFVLSMVVVAILRRTRLRSVL